MAPKKVGLKRGAASERYLDLIQVGHQRQTQPRTRTCPLTGSAPRLRRTSHVSACTCISPVVAIQPRDGRAQASSQGGGRGHMRQRGWSLPNEASALLFSETFKPPPRAKPLPIFSESAERSGDLDDIRSSVATAITLPTLHASVIM